MGMKKQPQVPSPGQKIGEWTLEKSEGAGGNGYVWQVSRPGYEPHAIKLLKSITKDTYARFKIEIEILEKLGAMDGIVPLLDKYLPELESKATPWFVMPLAVSFDKYINGKNPLEIVNDFIQIAEVVKQLHRRGISHRDIKPANFLYLNGRLCLSDFGLVNYPDKPEITPAKRDVGAKFTMAPEMRRTASQADGLPADVYSLSKSLWIALTGEELGFDGQYNPTSTMALINYLPATYTTTLDRLIVECTETDPLRRPDISSFITRLHEWISIVGDFHTRNLAEWSELTQKLFPFGAPTRTSWNNIDSICTVLAEIAKVKALNHMFYPTGGGNTITGVSRAAEPGLIALHIGEKTAELIKPEKLSYESFGRDASWSYFRLEAGTIPPSGIKGAIDHKGISETLTEIRPGVYFPYHCWDTGEHDGEPLPDTARPVSRFLHGSFVFFSTRSVYNRTSSTYDARHNKMTEDEFRDYIARNFDTDRSN
jgi:serine/threonine protein kinase